MDQLEYYQAKLSYETDSWDLAEAISNGEKIVVVDARSEQAYEIEHIPGAVNISHRTMSAGLKEQLDSDKVYVTYCDGIGCNASTKGALGLARLGFKVKELLGGLDWWKRDGYATAGKNQTAGREIACGC